MLANKEEICLNYLKKKGLLEEQNLLEFKEELNSHITRAALETLIGLYGSSFWGTVIHAISCFSYYCFVIYHPKLWQKKNKHFLMLMDSRGQGIRGMAYFCHLMCGPQLGDSNGWGWGSHFQHSFFTHTFGTLVTTAKRLGFPWDCWPECLHMGSLIRGPKVRLFN